MGTAKESGNEGPRPRAQPSEVLESGRRPDLRGLEERILATWKVLHEDSRNGLERDAFHRLLVQWVNARLWRVQGLWGEVAYDRFIDRVLKGFAEREPALSLLKVCWHRSCADAKRRTGWSGCQHRLSPRDEESLAASDSAESEFVAREVIEATRRVLGSLPPVGRRILLLRAAGRSFAEIASQLDMRESSARALCTRGRALLACHPFVRGHLRPT